MDLVKLQQYLPQQAADQVLHLFNQERLKVDIVPHRITRHGDYRRLIDGTHVITINEGENPYRFLLTLIHELAHFKAFSHYGRMIKPHGIEWKNTFRQLMLPFLRPEVFPETLLKPLAHYLKNPKASSDSDLSLTLALKSYDPVNDRTYIFDVPEGKTFKTQQGRTFIRGAKRTKRFICTEASSGRTYLFQPHVAVHIIEDN